ncbi:hypothetical protein K04M5_49390 (plasmid) [Vibrio alginolyticus]|nr:hypothetical protein K04M5_49390 [Vibrio alginolyticus]
MGKPVLIRDYGLASNPQNQKQFYSVMLQMKLKKLTFL